MRPLALVVALIVVPIALVLAAPATATAGACGELVGVTSVGGRLGPDGVVLLEASGDVHRLAAALAGARFVGDGVAAPVRVVRALEGGRLQALLAPATPLPPDVVVHLVVGDPELDARLATFALTATASPAASPPVWRRAPTRSLRRRAASNKGDSLDVVEIKVPLAAPAYVLATITRDGATAFAIYPAHDGTIAIGSTGCNSMWWAGGGRGRAVVTLTAIGANGDEVPAPGKPLRLPF
jgi:hypothetical protein